eukprot:CAMPEP_0184488438 /NCGR_PEP_ID=MMETSP0113_2-20130426/11894_1 /TAXON_ID=91329 /ORGANISM="Norrisiella sphaerica, Strain BC52" /LENGTH=82 /DNA_ID=CAMNT_0026871211 /DNA_START=76 /DNA_END=324 /DNA_ORIENTATION=-
MKLAVMAAAPLSTRLSVLFLVKFAQLAAAFDAPTPFFADVCLLCMPPFHLSYLLLELLVSLPSLQPVLLPIFYPRNRLIKRV